MKLSAVMQAPDALVRKLNLSDDLSGVLRKAGRTAVIQLGAAAVGFMSQLLLARWMGIHEYGVYVFAWSLMPPIAVAAALGLSNAVVRFAPQYVALEEWGKLRGLIGRGSVLVLGFGLAFAALGWAVVAGLSGAMAAHYVTPVQIALLSIPSLAYIGLLSGLSRGLGEATLASVPQFIVLPLLIVLGTGITTLLFGESPASRIMILSVAACALTALWNGRRFRTILSVPVRSTLPEYETRHWLRVALPLFLADGAVLILWSTDIVMVGSFLEPADVSIYNASVRIAGLALLISTAVTAFATPRFSALLIHGDDRRRQNFVRSIAAWIFWPTAALVLVVVIGGKQILQAFGSEFVIAYPALVGLALGNLVYSVTGPVNAYLAVSDNHDTTAVINWTAAVCNIGLNLLLIPRLGVMGAVLASVLSVSLVQIWRYSLVVRRLGLYSHPFVTKA